MCFSFIFCFSFSAAVPGILFFLFPISSPLNVFSYFSIILLPLFSILFRLSFDHMVLFPDFFFFSFCFSVFFPPIFLLAFFSYQRVRTSEYEVRTRLFCTCFFYPNHEGHPAPTSSMLSSIYQSTVQHSTAQSAISHAQSSEARTCPPECDNAGKQTKWARAGMSSICSCCVLKANEEIEICPAKNYIPPQHAAGQRCAKDLPTLVCLSDKFV